MKESTKTLHDMTFYEAKPAARGHTHFIQAQSDVVRRLDVHIGYYIGLFYELR